MNPLPLKKYKVGITFERFQEIAVEATSGKEARALVAEGEFETNQIVNTIDDNAQVVSVNEVK